MSANSSATGLAQSATAPAQQDLPFAIGASAPKFAAVSAPNYRVRRATLDDIGPLMDLWKSMHFPVEELSRRVTDFQVAESSDGKLLGALAIQIAEKQGRIHSEAFTDFSLAEQLRPLLWERINTIATNHGLLRLWTKENAPFWSRCGLAGPDPEALSKLPMIWRNEPANWLTLKLRDDLATLISADHEFAMFMQAEKDRTARTMQQAKILKVLATLVALGLLAVVLAGAFYIFKNNPHLQFRR